MLDAVSRPPAAMVTIYRKTDKGQAEIETRAHRLTPRLRQALIVIDGKRTGDELRKLILNQPDEALQTLLDGGFIEPLAPPAAAAVPVATAAPRPAMPAPAAAGSPSTMPGGLPPGADLNAVKRAAVRQLTDSVGPVGESLALKIEKCRNAAELQPLLRMAFESIRNTRGTAAAAPFAERFLPPGSV